MAINPLSENISIFAIDTSARYLSCAYLVHDRILTHDCYLGNRFTSDLLPILEKFWNSVTTKPDLVVYGKGPGSFTGLRIALATAAAFAYVHQASMLAVCNFRAYALDTLEHYPKKTQQHVCQVLIHAGRVGHYVATLIIKDGLVDRQVVDCCHALGAVKEQRSRFLAAVGATKWIACGPAWSSVNTKAADVWEQCDWCRLQQHPSAACMLALAQTAPVTDYHQVDAIPELAYLQAST